MEYNNRRKALILDIVALGELLVNFISVSTDSDGDSTVAGYSGGTPACCSKKPTCNAGRFFLAMDYKKIF